MLYLQSSAISTVKSQEIYDNDFVVEHVAQLSLLKIEDLDEWWNVSPTDLSLVISICWHTCKNHSLKSSYEALCQFPTNGSLSGLWRRGCRANCNGLLTWSHSTAIRDFIRIHAKAFELLWLHRERHRHANSMQSMSSSGGVSIVCSTLHQMVVIWVGLTSSFQFVVCATEFENHSPNYQCVTNLTSRTFEYCLIIIKPTFVILHKFPPTEC